MTNTAAATAEGKEKKTQEEMSQIAVREESRRGGCYICILQIKPRENRRVGSATSDRDPISGVVRLLTRDNKRYAGVNGNTYIYSQFNPIEFAEVQETMRKSPDCCFVMERASYPEPPTVRVRDRKGSQVRHTRKRN